MGKSSKQTVQKTVYGSTKTTNPYVISATNNKGTTSDFVKGNALDTINNFVNSNIGNVLNDYLNPSLKSAVNQSLLRNYANNLYNTAGEMIENDIVNPLANRNMLRSSQATNMYNNLTNKLSDNLSNYIGNLLENSQKNSSTMLNDLLNAYVKGYSILNLNQAQSLSTSKGNAKRTNTTKSGDDSILSALVSALSLFK